MTNFKHSFVQKAPIAINYVIRIMSIASIYFFNLNFDQLKSK